MAFFIFDIFLYASLKNIKSLILKALLPLNLAIIGTPNLAHAEATSYEKVQKLYHQIKKEHPKIKEISARKVQKELTPNHFILVDVRKKSERKISVIPGALSKKEFLKKKSSLAGQAIVVYCTIGKRSAVFAEKLKEQGLEVYNLQAGILGWIYSGGRLVDPATKTTKRVHLYGSKWNLPPKGYKSQTFWWVL